MVGARGGRLVGGVGDRVSEFFFTMNPNISFFFFFWSRGWGGGGRVSEFSLQRIRF